MQRAVSAFEEEFPEQVVCRNVDATTPESMRIVQELGFRNHGLVIRSSEGATLWKQPDHEVDVEAVRGAIRDLAENQEP